MKALFSSENDFCPSELHGRNTEDTEKTPRRNHILEKLQHLQCSGLISGNRKGEIQNSVEETKLRSRYFAPKTGPGKSDPVRKEGPHNNVDSLGKPLARGLDKPNSETAASGMQITPSISWALHRPLLRIPWGEKELQKDPKSLTDTATAFTQGWKTQSCLCSDCAQ